MLLELIDDNGKLTNTPEQTQAQKDNTYKTVVKELVACKNRNKNSFIAMLTWQGEQPHQSAKIKLELLQWKTSN